LPYIIWSILCQIVKISNEFKVNPNKLYNNIVTSKPTNTSVSILVEAHSNINISKFITIYTIYKTIGYNRPKSNPRDDPKPSVNNTQILNKISNKNNDPKYDPKYSFKYNPRYDLKSNPREGRRPDPSNKKIFLK